MYDVQVILSLLHRKQNLYIQVHTRYKHNPGLHVLKKSKTKSQLILMTNRDGPKKSVQALVCLPTFVRG